MIRLIFGIIGWIWGLIKAYWFIPVGIFVGLYILAIIVGLVEQAVEHSRDKKILQKFNSIKSSSLSDALGYLKNAYATEGLSASDYEKELLDLADKHSVVDAMKELSQYYQKHMKGMEDKAKNAAEQFDRERYAKFAAEYSDKSAKWFKRAAETGDIESIRIYYGFDNSDYDINSKDYDEIIRLLANTRPVSEEDIRAVDYMRGVVFFRKGDIESAKQAFLSATNQADDYKSMYMLAQCFLKENNLPEAEKILQVLEDHGFKMPAAIDKQLYDYYSNTNSPAFDLNKAYSYVQKYANNPQSNEKESADMLKETLNKLADAYHHGTYGFDKDITKALMYYENAAKMGITGAMTAAGILLLAGEYDGVFINRDRLRANDYLIKAMMAGDSQAKDYLQKYGVGGVVVVPAESNGTTYRFTGGYELSATGETMKWVFLYHGIGYKATRIVNSFADEYKRKFQSFKQLMDGVFQLYANCLALMLQWGMKLLMALGIDFYDATEIIARCNDLSLLPRIPDFERGLDAIDNRAEQLNLKTAYVQATRGYWVGGGFGSTIGDTIVASVKGSIAAGVMNAGSAILHGIGDSIVEAMNNSEIDGMGNKLFVNPKTFIEFSSAVASACKDIGIVIADIIEESTGLAFPMLDGQIIYHGESLASLEDNVLVAKLNNNMAAKNHDYSYALLLEKLRRSPMDGSALKNLYTLTPENLQVIKRYSGDFGIKYK